MGERRGGPEDDGGMDGCDEVEGADDWESDNVVSTDVTHGRAHGSAGGGSDNHWLLATRGMRDGVSNGHGEYNRIKRAASWRSKNHRDTDEVIAVFETAYRRCLYVELVRLAIRLEGCAESTT